MQMYNRTFIYESFAAAVGGVEVEALPNVAAVIFSILQQLGSECKDKQNGGAY